MVCFQSLEDRRKFECNRNYLHRLQLRGPNEKALLLASTTGTVVNRVEFAGDLIFNSQEDRDAWWRFIWKYHVQFHRRGQKVLIGKGVKNENGKIMYDEVGDIEDATYLRTAEDLWHPNYLVAYRDKVCRITGEVWCLHLEIRTTKKKYVNRRGIFKPSDLINFDVLALLKKELLFAAINSRVLGRKYLNWKARKTFRKDAQLVGEDILRKLGSTQNVLDTYEDLNRLWECLIPISISAVFDTIEKCQYLIEGKSNSENQKHFAHIS